MNPLRRYHDWATAPERVGNARLLFLLPLLAMWTPTIAASLARGKQPWWWEGPLLLIAVAASLVWIGYWVGRALIDLACMALRFVRLVGPDWRRGWRAAWREVRGR